jgi:DNA gyrase/topoisomerase IV subunit A
MVKKIKYQRLTDLHKALLVSMFEQGITPDTPTRKCYHIIMDFIEKYGNYFCDSIHEIQQSLYSLSHEWEFRTPFIEARGFTGEPVEDRSGNNIQSTSGANMRYVECRLSQAGIDYIANHRSLKRYKRPIELLMNIKPCSNVSTRQRVKPTHLTELQEVILLHMAKEGYWPEKPSRKSFNITIDFIKKCGDFYTDSISSVIDALYDMSHDWMFSVPLIEALGDTGRLINIQGNLITEEVGASYLFTEVRLSKAGFNYVIDNNLINKYSPSKIDFPLWG